MNTSKLGLTSRAENGTMMGGMPVQMLAMQQHDYKEYDQHTHTHTHTHTHAHLGGQSLQLLRCSLATDPFPTHSPQFHEAQLLPQQKTQEARGRKPAITIQFMYIRITIYFGGICIRSTKLVSKQTRDQSTFSSGHWSHSAARWPARPHLKQAPGRSSSWYVPWGLCTCHADLLPAPLPRVRP
jgi:hypothetical protein